MKISFPLAMIALTSFLVTSIQAKPATAPKSWLSYDYQMQDDPAAGVVHVIVKAQPAQAGFDLDGELVAILDGQEVARARLDSSDRAVLAFDIPRDGGRHEVCLKFTGTATSQVRGKTQVQPIQQFDCRTLSPLIA